jgi:preprotein translocase subunit SecD
MQGNGFKIGSTIFFVLLCGYYLFPSMQNAYLSYKMGQMEGEELQEYQQENRARLDRIKQESLKLGLDLQGGMHVTLEVQIANLLEQLASNKDDTFREVLQAATERARAQNASLVNTFVTVFEERDPEVRLSRYFRSEEANITRRSTNDEVQSYLQTEANEAVDRAMQIVRNRVDRYGVTEPSIQKKGDRRVVVELPGVEDPERVRNLLESASQLTFHLMANPQELQASVQEIIEYYEPSAADTAQVADAEPAEEDSAPASEGGTELVSGADDTTDTGTQIGGEDESQAGPQNPLLAAMQPLPAQQQPIVGTVYAQDTSRVNDLLTDPQVQRMIPDGVSFLWSANPRGTTQNGQEVFQLLAVRSEIELSGETITEASVEFDRNTNQPRVSMTMNSDGARTWSRITGANVGEQVAIVLDGVVYSNPRVDERITGGRSSITGLESRQEAQDIVTVLQSGALPAPVDIVEERTVGPSLGEESIRAGFISVTVGLMLVALFMIMYYRTAGAVADVALLLNIILILGILAGFNATLTLPGIAGIVLTIGMAVDANVLIFDRVREEQATGKTIKAAIAAGYEKSLSAILDANITTFFVGVILYSFGVGPIQGFAVTLMAGILSSLFTAIIVTRILFDYMVEERQMQVSYG